MPFKSFQKFGFSKLLMAVDLSSQALSVEALASKGASGVFGSDAAAP